MVFGGLSVILYKPWRQHIDKKRFQNASYESADESTETGFETEGGRDSDRKDDAKAMDVNVQSVEATDAAGPSGVAR